MKKPKTAVISEQPSCVPEALLIGRDYLRMLRKSYVLSLRLHALLPQQGREPIAEWLEAVAAIRELP